MLRSALLFALATATATAATGCSHSVLVHRPKDAQVDQALTKMWTSEIQRVAQDGDWLLVRSYASVGDAIVVLTSGEEISHAAMYDGKTGTVIEAITPAVREIPLEELVGRNRYVIVVRPQGTAAQKRASVMRARSTIGTGFDLRGMFGVADREDRFYCSELVYWAGGVADTDQDDHFIITPVSLIEHGEVVYFSGRRDDAQLQRVARGWSAEHEDVRVGAVTPVAPVTE
ncbi:MAG TPA: YiiX/YebB-like N1pC/P60 family cysteine hydrolase [Kofleriaceae bacterium]|nr:YiiX/YebB-like N1pC/P60 family cysteine hydrolase [Kofleriaceae bacterium]